jgi:metal-dependent hydrolase (beta-lactamase superfamily II)
MKSSSGRDGYRNKNMKKVVLSHWLHEAGMKVFEDKVGQGWAHVANPEAYNRPKWKVR